MKKIILLTGASSGIGYQTAKSLAKEGHVVYGAARRIEKEIFCYEKDNEFCIVYAMFFFIQYCCVCCS